MMPPIKKVLSRCGLPLVALGAGWLGGQAPWLELARPARAATPLASLAPLDRLLIEDDIRQRIALYGLYVDGDGTGGRPRNLRLLADTLMTPDVVSEVYSATGAPPMVLSGREIVAQSRPGPDPEAAKRIAGRHYLVNTVFDSVTATTAATRTTAVYFDATKNLVGSKCASAGDGACGGMPVKTYMWVYEISWRKTPDGWQIARNILRNDN